MWDWNDISLCLCPQLWALAQHSFNMKGLTLIVIFHFISICLCIWFDDTGDRGSFCSPLTEGKTQIPMGPGDSPYSLTQILSSGESPHLSNLPLSRWPF